MIISFDLDNTLIPYGDAFEVEQPSFLYKALGAEPLRVGTRTLFKTLREQGHTIWIYTTSYRSVVKMRLAFLAAGLRPDRFINQNTNLKILNAHSCKASKHPGLFGIDLHIDDSAGVGMEGEELGFRTLILNTDDEDWVEKIVELLQK